MIRKTRLYTPGPTPLLPAAQFAMAAADIHHRTAEFRALYTRVLAQLKEFVGTNNDVLILASSGTGAMEASVSNLTSPGDRVLVLTAGKFGERWTGITKAFGCEVDVVSAPYGSTFSLDAGQGRTQAGNPRRFRAGHRVLHRRPPRCAGHRQLLKDQKSEALFVVDAITGLGTTTPRYGRLGHRRADRRLAKGAHDSSRPLLPRGQPACLGPYGGDLQSALLLRSAQGAQERRQGRVRLHSVGRPHRRHGSLAGLHRRSGRRQPGGRPQEAGATTPRPAPP